MDVVESTLAPLLGEPLPVELMNTIWADRAGVHDALETSTNCAAWLRAVLAREGNVGLGEPAPGEVADIGGPLRGLRDALRRLAAETTEDSRPDAASAITGASEALKVLNQACASAPTWSALSWPADGKPTAAVRSAASPSWTALSVIGEQSVALLTGPVRDRLRACLAPGCVLYFVKQHPRREWCSAGCGNRARVARHYRRHHGENPG